MLLLQLLHGLENMEEKEETRLAMHSYVRRTLSTDMETVAGLSDGFVPLPDTPEPNPAKKKQAKF